MDVPDDVLALLRAPSTCSIATSTPDGSPQPTPVRVDTDGEHVVINTVAGFQELRNVDRDPRVALAVSDPAHPSASVQIRGDVVESTSDGAREHIDALSQQCLGRPCPGFDGGSQERVIVCIAPRRISSPRG